VPSRPVVTVFPSGGNFVTACGRRGACSRGRPWGREDSNLRLTDYESAALTTELLPRTRHCARTASVHDDWRDVPAAGALAAPDQTVAIELVGRAAT
jgi:hypothetical protein